MNKRILIVDDEVRMQRILQLMLEKLGFEVVRAGNGREALDILTRESADLLLTDMRMPEMDGMQLLRELRAAGNPIPAIVITAYGTIASAVEAMKNGASDYIIRPFEMETVQVAVKRALDFDQIRRENRFLRQQLESAWNNMIGDSPGMQAVIAAVAKVAATPTSVLVTGETGTGKELVARAIHRASGRSGLFVPVNCAAIPADMLESEMFGHIRGAFTGAHKDRTGKCELAHDGTLFLDEVPEMSLGLQAKLLRVLQENEVQRLGSNTVTSVDFRLITATNRKPDEAVTAGLLREDLYYRLNVFNIHVPPLRERVDDIPALCAHFLEKHAGSNLRGVREIEAAALQQLKRHAWPGNVRELENVIERSLIASEGYCIQPEDLPSEIAAAKSLRPDTVGDNQSVALQPRIEEIEQQMINRALDLGGSKAAAARLLEISERSLWYKLKKYRIS